MTNTTDDPDETPWVPLSLREKVYYALVRFLTVLFRVDFFDVYRRQEVTWDKSDEIYRLQMKYTENLKNEFLKTYKIQSEFYDDNEPDDWVPYTMWLVMRSDDTINPPVTITGERNGSGGFDVDLDSKGSEYNKKKRKIEILEELDDMGFIEPIIDETKN